MEKEQVKKTCILILLYDKEVKDSSTFNTIMGHKELLDYNTSIIIWNNGPSLIKEIPTFLCENFKIKLIQSIENKSLSCIYNDVLKNNNADRYIILDDDSSLNKEYIKDAYQISNDQIGVPEIWSKNNKISPRYRNNVIYDAEVLEEKYEFMSIGSGLVIGKNVLKIFENEFGSVFDERFVFYGVDTTFFFRLRLIKLYSNIKIIRGFQHSLSKFDEDKQSLFRIKERSYDMALSNKYYNSLFDRNIYNIRVLISFFLQKLRGKKPLYNLKYYIKAYIKGRHYRVIK